MFITRVICDRSVLSILRWRFWDVSYAKSRFSISPAALWIHARNIRTYTRETSLNYRAELFVTTNITYEVRVTATEVSRDSCVDTREETCVTIFNNFHIKQISRWNKKINIDTNERPNERTVSFIFRSFVNYSEHKIYRAKERLNARRKKLKFVTTRPVAIGLGSSCSDQGFLAFFRVLCVCKRFCVVYKGFALFHSFHSQYLIICL